MRRNRLGELQRNILYALPRNEEITKRSLTVQQIRLKIRPGTENIYSTEQSIRRALRQLEVRGYVAKDEYGGNWEDLHSEPWKWRLTPKAIQLVRVEIKLRRILSGRTRNQ